MSDAEQIQREETLEEFRRRNDAVPVASNDALRKTATVGVVMAAVEAIGEAVAAEIKQLRSDIAALKAQLAEITARGIHYEGVFDRQRQYKRAALVTSHGSLFAASRDTVSGECPNDASGAWTLCVKKGRDARDQGR